MKKKNLLKSKRYGESYLYGKRVVGPHGEISLGQSVSSCANVSSFTVVD